MNPKSPDEPREWLKRAKSNLARSKVRISGVYLEDLCYDAQQAVEKALKGLMIHLGIRFPFVHDITQLLTLLQNAGCEVPDRIKESGKLTEFAVESRYPGVAEPVTEEEYTEAVIIAEEVIQWAENLINTAKGKPK